MLHEDLASKKEMATIKGRFQVVAASRCDYLESDDGAAVCCAPSCCKSKKVEKSCPAKGQR